MHQNIAGFFNKKELIEITLNEMSETKEIPDLICLTETFVKKHCESNINLKGYKLGASFCRANQKRGGSCILHSKSITTKELHFLKDLAAELTFECCGLEIVEYRIILVCIYRTPTANVKSFFNKLQILLDKLKSFKKYTIITGDWNIDTSKKNNLSDELLEILTSYDLDLHIKTPTRRKSCIDHFASNIKEAIGYTKAVCLSDHDTAQLLSIPVKLRKTPLKNWYEMRRDYGTDNVNKFKYVLTSYPWQNLIGLGNIDADFTLFHNELILLYNLCFPTFRVRVFNKANTNSKWLTKGLKTSCRTKRKLRLSYYKKHTHNAKDKYRQYSKILRKCIQLSQKNINEKYVNAAKNKCKATWDIINNKDNVIDKHNIEYLKINDVIIDHPSDIANTFNDHFIESTNLPGGHQQDSIEVKFIARTSVSIFLNPTDENEIVKIINTLNNTGSTGYDEICTKVVKACASEFAPLLARFVNGCFEEGIFPSTLKLSVVKPLFKHGERYNIINYRPIALVPVLSKVFEKIMQLRLISFFTKQSIIREEQFGFRKGRTTALACYSLIKNITLHMGRRIPVSTILFDMSKAFDFVNHETLLSKLERYGVRGPAYSWIRSYLDGRTQFVEIPKLDAMLQSVTSRSNIRVNRSGVPQGSILGPLFFILYINDLPNCTQYPVTLFADDISVTIHKNYKTDYNDEINTVIKDITNWLEHNNLKINTNKTKYIQFHNKNGKPQQLSVHHNNDPIAMTASGNFLGIVIDSELTWRNHVDMVCQKINRFVFALYRLSKLASLKTALTAYHGYVGSVLRYGLILWGNSTHINRVFILQKKCIRSICDVGQMESCRPLFKKLKILTLPSLYIFEILTFTKKNTNLFTKQRDNCNRGGIKRYPWRLSVPQAGTSSISRNCHSMCVRLFNLLPNHIQKLQINVFKRIILCVLIDNCFYDINEFIKFCRDGLFKQIVIASDMSN
jgi:exonuclease III